MKYQPDQFAVMEPGHNATDEGERPPQPHRVVALGEAEGDINGDRDGDGGVAPDEEHRSAAFVEVAARVGDHARDNVETLLGGKLLFHDCA